jgi:hypothetical protein
MILSAVCEAMGASIPFSCTSVISTPLPRLDPLTVTLLPPIRGPTAGVMDEMIGAMNKVRESTKREMWQRTWQAGVRGSRR